MKEFIDKLIEHFKSYMIRLAEEYNQYNQNLDKVKQEPKTRIERIRSMSVEEMADKIMENDNTAVAFDFCQRFEECQEDISEEECKKCLIQWLNSPEPQKVKIYEKEYL